MNNYSTSWWSLLLINRPREDERLSWPCYQPINGYPSAAGPVQTSESSPISDRRSTTEPPNHHATHATVNTDDNRPFLQAGCGCLGYEQLDTHFRCNVSRHYWRRSRQLTANHHQALFRQLINHRHRNTNTYSSSVDTTNRHQALFRQLINQTQ